MSGLVNIFIYTSQLINFNKLKFICFSHYSVVVLFPLISLRHKLSKITFAVKQTNIYG